MKRFQFVSNKWIKSQKVVEFPRSNFDPTEFLASVPKETLLRHAELIEEEHESEVQNGMTAPKPRERVESTSLATTPVVDGALQDFHQHKLMESVDPFKLNYRLYAIVVNLNLLASYVQVKNSFDHVTVSQRHPWRWPLCVLCLQSQRKVVLLQ